MQTRFLRVSGIPFKAPFVGGANEDVSADTYWIWLAPVFGPQSDGCTIWRRVRPAVFTMATLAGTNKHDLDDRTAHRDAVRRFLASMTGDPTLAEDLTQETFLRAERTRAGYRGEASVKTWLFAIALNLARDQFRAAARRGVTADLKAAEDLPSAELGAELAAMQKEMSTCIGRFVLQLPARQREAVALHDVGGLDHAQVAMHLGVAEGNARVLLHRGRAALRKILEENCVLSFDDRIPCEPRRRD